MDGRFERGFGGGSGSVYQDGDRIADPLGVGMGSFFFLSFFLGGSAQLNHQPRRQQSFVLITST